MQQILSLRAGLAKLFILKGKQPGSILHPVNCMRNLLYHIN